MEKITELLNSLGELGDLLPELEKVTGWVQWLISAAVRVGPVCILVLGLIYLLIPPKEANHSAGYRFAYGMRKVKSWRFMQRVAGTVYSVLGLVLTVVMAFQCQRLGSMDVVAMLWFAVKCIFWELVSIVAASFIINAVVMLVYDSQGNNRAEMRELFKEYDEEEYINSL